MTTLEKPLTDRQRLRAEFPPERREQMKNEVLVNLLFLKEHIRRYGKKYRVTKDGGIYGSNK